MWIHLAVLALWLFSAKNYHTLKFNITEKGGDNRSVRFYSYLGKLSNVTPRDFSFILKRANTLAGENSKMRANVLLLLFYLDLILLMFLKDVVEFFK